MHNKVHNKVHTVSLYLSLSTTSHVLYFLQNLLAAVLADFKVNLGEDKKNIINTAFIMIDANTCSSGYIELSDWKLFPRLDKDSTSLSEDYRKQFAGIRPKISENYVKSKKTIRLLRITNKQLSFSEHHQKPSESFRR